MEMMKRLNAELDNDTDLRERYRKELTVDVHDESAQRAKHKTTKPRRSKSKLARRIAARC